METYSYRLVEALSAAKLDVETIALSGRQTGAAPHVGQLLLFGLTASMGLLLSKPARITHVGDLASWPLALLARLRSARTRIVISVHGTDAYFATKKSFPSWLYRCYLRLGARLLPAARVIANSRATAELAARYGWRDISVVPLATDIEPVSAVLPGDQVFFAGRIMRRKGCGWFVREVLPLLPEEITLRVAGTVWEEDEAKLLRRPRVECIGPVYGAELAKEYAGALCVIVPTLDFEGFGLAASEAAVAGGVVIAADHSGLKDAVRDGESGFLLPIDDPATWARKIREIRGWTRHERQDFTSKSSRIARQYYSWERVARQTLETYGAEIDLTA